MKTKILALAVLSMVGWALSVSNASAFWLLPHCFHKNRSVIVCRPYNAFTPICYGSMVCDGCCPSPLCGAPMQQNVGFHGGGYCHGGHCGNGGWFGGDHGYAGAGPIMMPGQYLPAPAQGGPNFSPPPPTPAPAPSPVYNQTSLQWNPQMGFGVHPAGYSPPYHPMNYYPVSNYPMVPAMPAPHYWYGQ